jgi:hypothetical protein
MAIIQYLEWDADIKSVYKWIQKKLGINNDYLLPKPTYSNVREDNYNPKYIVNLLTEKNFSGKAFFYFRNLSDYITLSSIGQLNVKGGEGELFKAWGVSEFRNFKPRSIFQELENEIIRINFIATSNGRYYSFNSYKELINWLLEK